MRASITFLIIWFVFIILGFVGSFIAHSDLNMSEIMRIWMEKDIIIALVGGWILSALVILGLYSKSNSDKNKDKEKEENK